MPLTQQTLDYLIQPFKARGDIRLYEALKKLGDTQIELENELNADEPILKSVQLRYVLPGVQAVANDVLPSDARIRFPLDSSNNFPVSVLQLTRAYVSAKVAPVGSTYIVDVLISKDGGTTFNSIFAPTNANKLVLPIGLKVIKYGNNFITNTLQDGWPVRIDVLQADGTVAGCEVILEGNLIV